MQPAVFLDNSLRSPGFQTGFLRGLELLKVPHTVGEIGGDNINPPHLHFN